nr:phage portal protein [Microcella frigidaquae]
MGRVQARGQSASRPSEGEGIRLMPTDAELYDIDLPEVPEGALTAVEISTLVDSFFSKARQEWARLETLQKKIDGKLTRTWMPANADMEYKDLFRKASSPWLDFAAAALGQGCRIDGFSDEVVWRQAWQASGMDGRQGHLTRQSISLGYSYLAVIPHRDPEKVLLRPMSALKTFAVYDEPWDDYPRVVLHLVEGSLRDTKSQKWMLITEEGVHRFSGGYKVPGDVEFAPHSLGYTPVARIGATYDDVPRSIVEPALPVYNRVVDATFTLQMVQRYGAFPQKWMAGGEALDENVRVAVDTLIQAVGVNGETARFGSFQPADLDQVVKALEAHIRHMLSILQVPPTYGPFAAMVNMSAEGIAAAEAGYFRHLGDLQDPLGEGYELALRMAGDLLNVDVPDDAEVSWADVSSRSLAQAADAIQKLASLPSPPPLEMLLGLLPGWKPADAIAGAQSARAIAPIDVPPAIEQ